MRPGCQVDCVLVIEGWQGAGKTSGFRALVPVPEWYADTGVVVGSKDSYGALHGVWIYGMDELDSARRVELTKLKNFITQTRDHYRPPYAARDQDFVRQNVFCGTTNEEQYLPDRTGNRRIWPARCLRQVDVAAIARDRDQLWAEAVVRFRAGHPWHVDTPGLKLLCEAQQAERQETDPWTEIVSQWLRAPTQVEMWGQEAHRVPLDLSAGVATADVLLHCLGLRRGDVEVRHEMRVGAALRDLGYRRRRVERDGRREYRYLPPEPEPAEEPEGQ
jgi:predicted P-loop ATPase